MNEIRHFDEHRSSEAEGRSTQIVNPVPPGPRGGIVGPRLRSAGGKDSGPINGRAGGSPETEGSRFTDTAEIADSSALIWDGTAADRERAARSLHEQSPRRNGPFVAVRCGALPADLLESELFGYERGAFAGAHRQKPGKIEAARTGTCSSTRSRICRTRSRRGFCSRCNRGTGRDLACGPRPA